MNPELSTKTKQLNPEQQNLVLTHMAYAKNLARKINYSNIDDDDIEAAAMEGLCRAALNYDGRNEAKFATYLFMYIYKAVNETVRLIRGSETLSVNDEFMTDDDGNTINPLPDTTESPFENIDNQEYVEHLLKGLTQLERKVIEYTYGLKGGVEYSVKKIAAMEHLSEYQVRRCLQTAMGRLRGFMGGMVL